jgi:hypothetical protein
LGWFGFRRFSDQIQTVDIVSEHLPNANWFAKSLALSRMLHPKGTEYRKCSLYCFRFRYFFLQHQYMHGNNEQICRLGNGCYLWKCKCHWINSIFMMDFSQYNIVSNTTRKFANRLNSLNALITLVQKRFYSLEGDKEYYCSWISFINSNLISALLQTLQITYLMNVLLLKILIYLIWI